MFIRFNIPDYHFSDILRILFSWVFVSTETIERRTREMILKKTGNKNIQYFASARQALVWTIQNFTKPDDVVCVPEYVCPSVITAINKTDRRIFYASCAEDSPEFDYEKLKRDHEDKKFDWIISCNSHGHLQNLNKILEITDHVIVDDAYMALLLTENNIKDISLSIIWSMNFKLLCGPGGGMLLTPRHDTEVVEEGSNRASKGLRSALDGLKLIARALMGNMIPSSLKGGEKPDKRTKTKIRQAWLDFPEGKMNKIQMSFLYTQFRSLDHIKSRVKKNNAFIRKLIEEHPLLGMASRSRVVFYPRQIPMRIVSSCEENMLERLMSTRNHFHAAGIQTDFAYPKTDEMESIDGTNDLRDSFILFPCGSHFGNRQMKQIQKAFESFRNIIT